MADVKFSVDYSKRVSKCKKCKEQLAKQSLRIAKLTPNPFGSGEKDEEMKAYYHPDCIFDTFTRVRAGTKVIETPADMEGWTDLSETDKADILKLIETLEEKRKNKKASPAKKQDKQSQLTQFFGKNNNNDAKTTIGNKAAKATSGSDDDDDYVPEDADAKLTKTRRPVGDAAGVDEDGVSSKMSSSSTTTSSSSSSRFDRWSVFCQLCDTIASHSKYTEKSADVETFIHQAGYDGDVHLLIKLLIPKSDQRVFNLKEKQLIKLFANVYCLNADRMTDHFNQSGDVSETVAHFVGKSADASKTAKSSQLTIQYVDKWLDDLTKVTKDDDQQKHLAKIAKLCTPDDLLYVIRLIKKDLRFNAGAKHILDGLNPTAYQAFQASRDLDTVIDKALAKHQSHAAGASPKKHMSISVKVGTPVLPMLAEACRSTAQAMKRCPNGMYSEIKYDGERVQIHKHGEKFSYFSRSLKPVQAHKVQHLSEYLPKAFPGGGDMILDSEVLMVDTDTGKPLPFGTLGVHKKEKFSNAVVGLFVFDCLLIKGESLMDKPLKERRRTLVEHVTEIPNRVMLSNYEHIENGDHHKLKLMIAKAIEEGLEGLVLKDVKSIYEPGKRHWCKVKKDYLEQGKMADSADLIVLGAYYGTGNKGGMMSVFLMGSHDPKTDSFVTVTKCGNGHDDATLEKINKQLASQMKKIGRDYDRLPSWLKCSRTLVPDFVANDPKKCPIWEIAGAEFSKADHHTAGVSIRFPRVTKIRDDKNWQSATNLQELKKLYETSKEKADFDDEQVNEEEDETPLWKGTSTTKTTSATKTTTTTPSSSSPSSSSTPTKRAGTTSDTSPSSSSSSPPSKMAKVDKSPSPAKGKSKRSACRYGSSCYQKNPKHRQQFCHPGDADFSDNPSNGANAADDDDEPSKEFLEGLIINIPRDMEEFEKLSRLATFYGADCQCDGEFDREIPDDIIFICSGEGEYGFTSLPRDHDGDKLVSVDWLRRCFKENQLVSTKAYEMI